MLREVLDAVELNMRHCCVGSFLDVQFPFVPVLVL